MRKRTAAPVVAGLALALAAASLPMTAQAAPLPTAPDSSVIVVLGDSDTQVVQLEDELFGRIQMVPGASAERSVTVRNAGPTDGELVVAIVNVTAHDQYADEFHDVLLVNGGPASDLVGAETVVHQVPLAQGESTVVDFSVDFPAEATSGNAALVGAREFAFDVRLTLSGELPVEVTPKTEDPVDDPVVNPVVDPVVDSVRTTPTATTVAKTTTTAATTTGAVSNTGGNLAGTNMWLIAAAAVLGGIGTLAFRPLVAGRPRRRH